MKRNYVKITLLTIAIVGLMSCKNSGRTLTSATGTIYECLVVINSQPIDFQSVEMQTIMHETPALMTEALQDASMYMGEITTTYDLVKAVMGADMPCLPQKEPYFTLTEVATLAFDDFLKPTRNILYVDIDPNKYTQTKAKIAIDYWSHPQAFYRIQAPSNEAFIAYWLHHGMEIRDWFVRQELSRQGKFYRASTNKDARKAYDKQFACDMLIPEDYMLIMDTVLVSATDTLSSDKDTRLVWCCNSKGSLRRDIIVYSYPYTDDNTFTAEYLSQKRDEILGKVVQSGIEGSRMGTEYNVFPPVMRYVLAADKPALQGEFYAAELRGLWKIYNGESMGGPFVSLTRVDEVNRRIITAEAFIFASGQKKRNELRKAEAVLYTLQLAQERNTIDEVVVEK